MDRSLTDARQQATHDSRRGTEGDPPRFLRCTLASVQVTLPRLEHLAVQSIFLQHFLVFRLELRGNQPGQSCTLLPPIDTGLGAGPTRRSRRGPGPVGPTGNPRGGASARFRTPSNRARLWPAQPVAPLSTSPSFRHGLRRDRVSASDPSCLLRVGHKAIRKVSGRGLLTWLRLRSVGGWRPCYPVL